jgi:hypothetical protein
MCEGFGDPLGSLGRLMHYRCACCGWTFAADDSADQFETTEEE